MKSLRKKKKSPRWTRILAVVLAGIVLAGMFYANDYYRASQAAVEAVASVDSITVEEKDGVITFMPENPIAGIIFYPGGKVEYASYAPLMQKFAQRGIAGVVIEMPANLAVLDVDAADGIKEQYPQITKWYMAGHSLGGSMAASYVAKHSEEYAGLILLAAYSTEDLTATNLQVISIYGSEDKVLDMEKYEEYRENLPETTSGMVIGGGCHAYFGDYGAQEGDGEPWISMENQMEQTADVVAKYLK